MTTPTTPAPMTAKLRARLIEGATRTATGCLEWRALSHDRYGYGRLKIGRKLISTHRLAYLHFVGEIGPGLHVLHRCDNRCCIEPSHLFLGTNTENTRDRNNKARQARGEANGRSKLTADDVRAIRESGQLHRVIAKRYGVSENAIHCIKTGKSWRHV